VRTKCQAIRCLVPPGIAMLPAAVHAIGINPGANFALRPTTNAGPATHIDNTRRDGKFDRFLANIAGSVVLFGLGLGGTRNWNPTQPAAYRVIDIKKGKSQ